MVPSCEPPSAMAHAAATGCVRCIATHMQGTGLRNFLRPFRGVSKWYLASFEWANNLKRATDAFLGPLLSAPHSTDQAS